MQKSNQALMAVLVIALLFVGGFWYMSMKQPSGTMAPSPISESATIIVASPAGSTRPTGSAMTAGSARPSTSPEVDKNLVSITKNTFVPGTLNIKVGETVTWVNNDTYAHNVVSDDKTFESKTMSQGDKYSFTFLKAGTYDYICSIHPSMKGKIVVTN